MKTFHLFLIAIAASLLFSCKSPIEPENDEILGITLLPISDTVLVEKTIQFKAQIEAIGNPDTTLEWYVGDFLGGEGYLGNITQNGLYTAPEIPGLILIPDIVTDTVSLYHIEVDSMRTYTINVKSTADPTKTGAAKITVVLESDSPQLEKNLARF